MANGVRYEKCSHPDCSAKVPVGENFTGTVLCCIHGEACDPATDARKKLRNILITPMATGSTTYENPGFDPTS